MTPINPATLRPTISPDVRVLQESVQCGRAKPSDSLRQAFQDFAAGTFYKEMFKALRRTHDKPAYFHGGMAEDIFQDHLDQQVAEHLASDHGDALAGPLFAAFAQRLGAASAAHDTASQAENATSTAQPVE